LSNEKPSDLIICISSLLDTLSLLVLKYNFPISIAKVENNQDICAMISKILSDMNSDNQFEKFDMIKRVWSKIDNIDNLTLAISTLFQKIIQQPQNLNLYSIICNKLKDEISFVVEDNVVGFKKILMFECQKIFSQDINKENIEAQQLNIKFIGSLFVVEFLDENILHMIINELKEKIKKEKNNNNLKGAEENINQLVTLIKTIWNRDFSMNNEQSILNVVEEIDTLLGGSNPEILFQLRGAKEMMIQSIESSQQLNQDDYDLDYEGDEQIGERFDDQPN